MKVPPPTVVKGSPWSPAVGHPRQRQLAIWVVRMWRVSGYFRVLGTCYVHRAEQKGGGRRGTGSSLRLEPDNTGIAQAPRKSDPETRAGGRGESRFQVTEQVLWAQEYNHETRGVNLQPATPASGRTDSPVTPQSTRGPAQSRGSGTSGPRGCDQHTE